MQVTPLCERNQTLHLRLYHLRLGLGRLNALVLNDLLAEVLYERLSMPDVTRELVALLAVPHQWPLLGTLASRLAGQVRGLAASPLPLRCSCARSSEWR